MFVAIALSLLALCITFGDGNRVETMPTTLLIENSLWCNIVQVVLAKRPRGELVDDADEQRKIITAVPM